jgi:uncharacterized protein YlxW (UPF0749 family)
MNKQALLGLVACFLAAPAAMGAAPVYDASVERSSRYEQQSESRSPENLSEKVRLLEDELASLRGILEENVHKINQLEARQRDLYSDLDSRLNELKPHAAVPANH